MDEPKSQHFDARQRGPELRMLQQRIREASYLVAENSFRYRPIMRFFYERHMEHVYVLTVEDVHRHLRARVLDDPDYTVEACESDLAQLQDWGDLTAEQDRERGRTVEEFLRRRLLYAITPYGIAFERLLVGLEQSDGTGGSLDAGLFARLSDNLAELSGLLALPDPGRQQLEQTYRLWAERGAAWDLFEAIGTQGNDYLAQLRRSGDLDTVGDVVAFLAYKEVLQEYLSSYVKQLMDGGARIRAKLDAWSDSSADRVLVSRLALYTARYRPNPDGRLRTEEEVAPVFRRQVDSMLAWFRHDGGLRTLQRRTVDAIAMVVRISQRLMAHRSGVSRRRELEHLALAFAHCSSLEDAHRLAGVAFGAPMPRHLAGAASSWMLHDATAAWAQPAQTVELRPVRRGRTPTAPSAPVDLDSRSQRAALASELERRAALAVEWDALFASGELDLRSVELHASAHRDQLLDILGRCLAAPDLSAAAPDGAQIRIILPPGGETGEVRSTDGTVLLPRVILRRTSSRAHHAPFQEAAGEEVASAQ